MMLNYLFLFYICYLKDWSVYPNKRFSDGAVHMQSCAINFGTYYILTFFFVLLRKIQVACMYVCTGIYLPQLEDECHKSQV